MTVLVAFCAFLILVDIAQTIRLYRVKSELDRVRQAQARALEQIIREQGRMS